MPFLLSSLYKNLFYPYLDYCMRYLKHSLREFLQVWTNIIEASKSKVLMGRTWYTFFSIYLLPSFLRSECRTFPGIFNFFIIMSWLKTLLFNLCCFVWFSSRRHTLKLQETRGKFFVGRFHSRTCSLKEGEISRAIELEDFGRPHYTESPAVKVVDKANMFLY